MTWASIARPAPLPPLERAAILVPVRFEGVEGKPLYLQLDLGHPRTRLYAHKWADIAARRRVGTGEASRSSGGGATGVTFSIGDIRVSTARLPLRRRAGPGIDWNGPGIEIVGTAGADLVAGRVAVLDFEADRFIVANRRDGLVPPDAVFRRFDVALRRIVLPATLGGRAIKVFYDSGSSAFAWITSDREWRRMARAGAPVERFDVPSWGRALEAQSVATDARVTVGGVTLPVREVTSIRGTGPVQEWGVRALGIDALVGNQLFLGHRLVLDMRRREFLLEDARAAEPQVGS